MLFELVVKAAQATQVAGTSPAALVKGLGVV
jgi:hypothetical protein